MSDFNHPYWNILKTTVAIYGKSIDSFKSFGPTILERNINVQLYMFNEMQGQK